MSNRIRYEEVFVDCLDGEEWRPVVGYEGVYDVSSFGRIKRVKAIAGAKAGKVLRQHVYGKNYLYVMLCNGGKSTKKRFRVNRLVAAAFIGPAADGMHVNHKDGDKCNNAFSNLEYLTPSENALHYYASNPRKTCDLSPRAVREIRSSNETAKEMADRFKVGVSTIYGIRRGVERRRVV